VEVEVEEVEVELEVEVDDAVGPGNAGTPLAVATRTDCAGPARPVTMAMPPRTEIVAVKATRTRRMVDAGTA